MFSPATTQRPAQRITRERVHVPEKGTRRSLRELVRDAVDTAIEFATLGEANLSRPPKRLAPPAPHREHPHRRRLDRRTRARRAGTVPGRAHACTTPTHSPPAGHH